MSQARRHMVVARTWVRGTGDETVAVHGPYERGEAEDVATRLRQAHAAWMTNARIKRELRVFVVGITNPRPGQAARGVTGPMNGRDLTIDPHGLAVIEP